MLRKERKVRWTKKEGRGGEERDNEGRGRGESWSKRMGV